MNEYTNLRGFPGFLSVPLCTAVGTPYLTEAGVAMLSKPQVNIQNMHGFLNGFEESLGFDDYLSDEPVGFPGAAICKAAGQLCYASFSKGRTKNAQAQEYLQHILESGHGSLLQHINHTFLFYGLSRSCTHELVRHSAGTGFSQISQRYVSGKVLRFVERPEYQSDSRLHDAFLGRIDEFANQYSLISEILLGKQKAGDEILSGEAKTDLRKKVQQCARSVLPNETEAPIIVTANARAWRHMIEMRASSFAEVEIRDLLYKVCTILRKEEPYLFGDYVDVKLNDGTMAVTTQYRKV